MNLRLVATDVDGTIVGRDGEVSPRTRAALAACASAGVEVVLVTGRPPRWVDEVADVVGGAGVAVCGNGAVLYDLRERRVLRARTIDRATVLEVVARLRHRFPAAAFAIETMIGFRREPAYETRFDTGLESQVDELPDLLADDPGVVKLLVRVAGIDSDDLLAAAREELDGLAAPTHSTADGGLVEIGALGVSKAAALAELAEARDIDPLDVAAFGDMPNDAEMLRWAGRGWAMASGHPEAKEAADEVAPGVAEDGVAQVLELLLAARTSAI